MKAPQRGNELPLISSGCSHFWVSSPFAAFPSPPGCRQRMALDARPGNDRNSQMNSAPGSSALAITSPTTCSLATSLQDLPSPAPEPHLSGWSCPQLAPRIWAPVIPAEFRVLAFIPCWTLATQVGSLPWVLLCTCPAPPPPCGPWGQPPGWSHPLSTSLLLRATKVVPRTAH